MLKLLEKYIERLPKVQRLIEYRKLQGMFPAGHYYSPIPSRQDISRAIKNCDREIKSIKDVNLQDDAQQELLTHFANYYSTLEFTETETDKKRYFYDNDWFRHSDSIFLFCFINHFKPSRIVEVGSGFSSAVMLDAREQLNLDIDITFIEPFPTRLNSLLTEKDQATTQLYSTPVQDIPDQVFSNLRENDLLFIDSSHVLKAGSDLHHIMFNIIPLINKGVFVHFHDIFYPFEYPQDWLEQGRFWNENYMLRTFLAHNEDWKIELFGSYVNLRFNELISKKLPLCLKNHGGSLYLRKVT